MIPPANVPVVGPLDDFVEEEVEEGELEALRSHMSML